MHPIIEYKIKLQQKFTEKNGLPFFAPEDGVCFTCQRNIFQYMKEEEAGGRHITGCPYCHASFTE